MKARIVFTLLIVAVLATAMLNVSLASAQPAHETVDEEACPRAVALMFYRYRVHAYSRVQDFSLVSLVGETLGKSKRIDNPGFNGWVADVSTTESFVVLGSDGGRITDICRYWPYSTIGWTWVSNNYLLVIDFPFAIDDAANWFYNSPQFRIACMPNGLKEAYALAVELYNVPPHKEPAMGLHMHIREFFPDADCYNR